MVQVIENWAFLEGVVQTVGSSGVRDDLVTVDLVVDRIEPDEKFPNLFGEELQSSVSVVIPEKTVRQLDVRPGVRLRCRVRKASPFAVFADATDVTVVGTSAPDGGVA